MEKIKRTLRFLEYYHPVVLTLNKEKQIEHIEKNECIRELLKLEYLAKIGEAIEKVFKNHEVILGASGESSPMSWASIKELLEWAEKEVE